MYPFLCYCYSHSAKRELRDGGMVFLLTIHWTSSKLLMVGVTQVNFYVLWINSCRKCQVVYQYSVEVTNSSSRITQCQRQEAKWCSCLLPVLLWNITNLCQDGYVYFTGVGISFFWFGRKLKTMQISVAFGIKDFLNLKLFHFQWCFCYHGMWLKNIFFF